MGQGFLYGALSRAGAPLWDRDSPMGSYIGQRLPYVTELPLWSPIWGRGSPMEQGLPLWGPPGAAVPHGAGVPRRDAAAAAAAIEGRAPPTRGKRTPGRRPPPRHFPGLAL